MITYISIYTFIGVATFLSIYSANDRGVLTEIIACAVVATAWPLLFTARIIKKIIR